MPVKLKKDPLLKEWADYWLDVYVRPVAKPGGYEHYYDNMQKHILPHLGDFRLSKLSTPVIQLFLNEKAEHGNLRDGGPLSAKSIKNMRVVLDVCCKRAVAEGYMPGNPVPATVYKHCARKRVEVMSDEEQKVLEEWLFQNPSSANAGIEMALFSGMRLGEVCAERWKYFDPQRGCLRVEETVRRVSYNKKDAEYGKRTHLVFSEVKTEASKRDIYLSDVLMDLFGQQYELFTKTFGQEPGPEDFIFFSSSGGVMDPDNLSHYFGDVLEGLGLKHVKYHALRHTFATRAVETGVKVTTVSGILGHADVNTTAHYYLHPREEAMREAMTTMKPVTQNYMRSKVAVPGMLAKDRNEADKKQGRICRRKKLKGGRVNVRK